MTDAHVDRDRDEVVVSAAAAMVSSAERMVEEVRQLLREAGMLPG